MNCYDIACWWSSDIIAQRSRTVIEATFNFSNLVILCSNSFINTIVKIYKNTST